MSRKDELTNLCYLYNWVVKGDLGRWRWVLLHNNDVMKSGSEGKFFVQFTGGIAVPCIAYISH
jgi:hypothetical protein